MVLGNFISLIEWFRVPTRTSWLRVYHLKKELVIHPHQESILAQRHSIVAAVARGIKNRSPAGMNFCERVSVATDSEYRRTCFSLYGKDNEKNVRVCVRELPEVAGDACRPAMGCSAVSWRDSSFSPPPPFFMNYFACTECGLFVNRERGFIFGDTSFCFVAVSLKISTPLNKIFPRVLSHTQGQYFQSHINKRW